MQWFDGYYEYLRPAMIKRRHTRCSFDKAEKFFISSSGDPVDNPSEDLKKLHDEWVHWKETFIYFFFILFICKTIFHSGLQVFSPKNHQQYGQIFCTRCHAKLWFDRWGESLKVLHILDRHWGETSVQSCCCFIICIHPVLIHSSILTQICTLVSLVQLKSLSPRGWMRTQLFTCWRCYIQ